MDRFTLNIAPIDRALGIFEETNTDLAHRASVALSTLLAPLQQSCWPEVSLSFSRLTGDGFPLEFTFSSAVNAISYTTEIAGPEIPEMQKIKQAWKLLSAQTLQQNERPITAMISRLVEQPDLRYGAWVGGRHCLNVDDRYKIYLEITETCRDIGDDFLQSFIMDQSVLTKQQYRMRMMSIDNNNKGEYYFRLFNIDVWQLLYTMRCLGFAEQGRALLHFVADISKREIDKSFIGNNLGFSIATDAERRPVAISIFTFNYKVFEPGDSNIRKKILQVSERFGWDFTNYEKISEPVSKGTGRLTHHGLVAFSITRQGEKIMQIGLRPPDTK